MKYLKIILFYLFLFSGLQADENLKYFIIKAIDNNLQLNAERKTLESAKQNKNINRSEFLPSITISGNQTSSTSTNNNKTKQLFKSKNFIKISYSQKKLRCWS